MIGVRGAVTYPRKKIEGWIMNAWCEVLEARQRGRVETADKYMAQVDALLDDWAISE